MEKEGLWMENEPKALFRPSLAVFDLDGTLLHTDKTLSERTLKALLSAYESGVRLVFATARPPRAVEWLLPAELRKRGSFIFYNGAYIDCRFSGTTAHYPIPLTVSAAIVDYCAARYPDAHLGVEVKDEWYSNREVDMTTIMNVRGTPVVTPMEELRTLAATKLLLSGFGDCGPLISRFAEEAHLIVTDGGSLLQVMSREASKEQAIVLLCSAFGIGLEQTACFGDDHNDIGMFRTCGHGVAMGNAIEALKELSSEVTVTNDEDGVAAVVERWLGAGTQG